MQLKLAPNLFVSFDKCKKSACQLVGASDEKRPLENYS